MKKEYGVLKDVDREDLQLLASNPNEFWKGVTEIGKDVFSNETTMKSLNIPGSVKKIGDFAFSYNALESITISEGVEEVGNGAFYACEKLKEVEVSKSVKKIGDSAFEWCTNLVRAVIPEGVTVIGSKAFNACFELEDVTIPNSVKIINSDVFRGCNKLKNMTIPKGVTKIGKGAFCACTNLERIEIPQGVTSIENEVFKNCKRLESVTIPEGVTEIGINAFFECSSLKSVTIPNSVKTIGWGAFCACSSLEIANIPESVTSIASDAFRDCKSLKSATIPSSVKIIGWNVFRDCKSLERAVISEGVTEIGASAFKGCSKLKILNIPESVTSMGGNVFDGCDELKEITFNCKDGNHIVKVNDNVLQCLQKDINATRDFVVARDRLKKTFLPAPQVILNTPSDMVENFYKYSKNWSDLLGEFANSIGITPKDIWYEPKADFYKLCLISGVFSGDQKERDEAMRFVRSKIIGKFDELELHERFTGLETRENGFNPEYAKFLRLNFDDEFMIEDLDGEENSYFAGSYNRFKEVQEAYPNREIVTNTNSDRLTPELVEKFLQENAYSNVTEETRELSELCGKYGYSQEYFDKVSVWLSEGKKVKEEGGQQLFCGPDKETREDVVTYEFLEKDNPLGAVLGDITNCCQKVGDAGAGCCRHGMTDPNGGFVVFKKSGKIVGQSWVWYNEKLKKVCLDNVEVPRSRKESVMKKNVGFIDCLRRLKDGFVEGMKEQNKDVSHVTMGEGYNDILDIARGEFAPVEDRAKSSIFATVVQSASQEVLARSGGAPTGVYTDTRVGERLIE